MGIVLILFGISLFISQISKISAVNLFINLWPLILIILGGELLYCSYKRKKDEDLIIKFDIFSIFIVTSILLFNMAVYGLMETGIMDYIKLRVDHERQAYELRIEDYDSGALKN